MIEQEGEPLVDCWGGNDVIVVQHEHQFRLTLCRGKLSIRSDVVDQRGDQILR